MNKSLFCEDTERAFIGCIVQSQGSVLDEHRATLEHFFRFPSQTVFEVVDYLYTNGKPINGFSVRQRLSKEQVDGIGGHEVLAEMCGYPSTAMAGYLFGILNQKLSLRRTQEVISWAQEEIKSPEDPDAFCLEFTQRASTLSSDSDGENVVSKCADSIEARLDRIDRGEVEKGYKTPLDVWDNAFGGILAGQMYALAGRPGTGKTAMMEMLIDNLMHQGCPVTVFEKDMSPEKLLARIACRAVNFPFWRYARGQVDRQSSARIREVLRGIKKIPFYLYNPTNLTADKLCSIARRDIRTRGVGAIFLDHMQALRVGKSDLREGLTQASLTLRANVTETNVPHIILAHLNRNGSKGRPSPEDIKEFDQLYGDCDGMALLWSEKSRAELEPGEMLEVNFYVAKNRDGEVTDDSVLFDGEHLTFRNKAREK